MSAKKLTIEQIELLKSAGVTLTAEQEAELVKSSGPVLTKEQETAIDKINNLIADNNLSEIVSVKVKSFTGWTESARSSLTRAGYSVTGMGQRERNGKMIDCAPYRIEKNGVIVDTNVQKLSDFCKKNGIEVKSGN